MWILEFVYFKLYTILLNLKLVDCSTHKLKCPINNNDFGVTFGSDFLTKVVVFAPIFLPIGLTFFLGLFTNQS